MGTRGAWIGVAAMMVMATQAATGQPPALVNATVTSRAATGSLDAQFRTEVARASSPTWIAWAVLANESGRDACCGSGSDRDGGWRRCGCQLEGDNQRVGVTGETTGSKTIRLEASDRVIVLARAEAGVVQRITAYAADCELDAGGRPVVWLEGVRPPESVALLSGFAKQTGTPEQDRRGDGAVRAIAWHADPSAGQALNALVAPESPDKVRERAVFWLGIAGGKAGLETLTRVVTSDASDRVRERAVFAISVSKAADTTGQLIEIAHRNPSAHVRGQAIFWLAQKAGVKIAGVIESAIENDPDTDVKKRAVFALSQMPKDEGIPRLVEIARTNKNPAVRKQAVFWLGQSKDARALAFIEQVLTK
jgi:hypothetical protein